MGIGKNFQFEDNYPTKRSEGKDAKCLKVTLNCDDSENILMSDDKAVNDSFNFQMEKHLEEFIIANWNQTFLCKEYDIYKDAENFGRQFPTDTGPIDILAISKDKKTFLVIELKNIDYMTRL